MLPIDCYGYMSNVENDLAENVGYTIGTRLNRGILDTKKSATGALFEEAD